MLRALIDSLRRTTGECDGMLLHASPLRQRLDARLAQETQALWSQWQRSADVAPDASSEARTLSFMQFLSHQCQQLWTLQQQLHKAYRQFTHDWQHDALFEERLQAMERFALTLNPDPSAWRGDRKALRRWFGPDALLERYQRRCTDIERRLIFLCERLSATFAHCGLSANNHANLWVNLQLESLLTRLLTFQGNDSLRETGLLCLHAALDCWRRQQLPFPDRALLQYVFRCAQDPAQPVWVQCAALELIAEFAPGSFFKVLRLRLQRSTPGDDIFVRRRLAQKLHTIHEPGFRCAMMRRIADDASPYVRQALAAGLASEAAETQLELASRLLRDSDNAVRIEMLRHWIGLPALDDLCLEALATEGNLTVLRAACALLPGLLTQRWVTQRAAAEAFRQRCLALLTSWHLGHEMTPVRRWAALARERIHAASSASALPPELMELPLHARRSVEMPADLHAFARQLQACNDEGFGFNLRPGRKLDIVRDHLLKPRFWRLWHEWKHPATDKRQNYSHARGRVYYGLHQIAAPAVAEASKTKVPGEALHLNEEGGYRPYLPLLDHLQSALDQSWPTQPLRLYSAEGVTLAYPPSSLWARLQCKWRLSLRFGEIAAYRNWTADAAFGPEHYLQMLEALGFRFEFQPYSNDNGEPYAPDPRVLRFFPHVQTAAAWPLALSGLWHQFSDYFYSVYQNSLQQLLVFLALAGSWFFGRHAFANYQLQRARRAIPLVVGGWGTRGKSGTERLKAALFNALGYQVLSKTTGCEAMFLHGHAHRPLREMFLFRPYDKATIWEQVFLVRFAARIGSDVMLWECMGLNPRYVDILQRQWMRDDLSTLTNCYPDHEEIQGPAGTDVAQVIAGFIPERATVLTSEENMLPFLRDEAARKQTRLQPVSWMDAALLTQDVLAQFPYQEHPSNIALVVGLARELGLPADFALREMAQRVVPDLGVLKTYPEAQIGDRHITFINGCSANERHGTLSNWARMNMARSVEEAPQEWIVTVVNNRADRAARSEVFAGILVDDIGADRHALIGGNLDGLQTYIRNAFDDFYAAVEWRWNGEQELQARLEFLALWTKRLRIVTQRSCAESRLRAALSGLRVACDGDPHAALANVSEASRPRLQQQWQSDCAEADGYRELLQTVRGDAAGSHRDASKQLMWSWFSRRLLVLPDHHASGNYLIQRIVDDAPPGLLCKAMGLQNIKGTGLDFVYRWQAWDRHHQALQALQSHDDARIATALRTLAASQEFGVLEETAVTQALQLFSECSEAQNEVYQAEIAIVRQHLQQQLLAVRSRFQRRRPGGWREKWLTRLEQFLDSGAAVKRRKQANRIYRDLATMRIGHARAAIELKKLTQQQKGGWLKAARAESVAEDELS